ncbi:aminoacyl-histidine dipeptidase [Blattamonas nauphoetae]|nr:aminoacyl-histidine dipeptidase [Blattamonas nauphoetae]
MFTATRNFTIYTSRIDGGTKLNVIPQECETDVWVAKKDVEAFETKVQQAYQVLKADFSGHDDEMKLEIKKDDSSQPNGDSVLNPMDSHQIFALLMTTPHGVLRLSQICPGKVESSVNFYRCTLTATPFVLSTSFKYRSSSQEQIEGFRTQLESYALVNGFVSSEFFSEYPAWIPVPQSKLLSVTKRAYAAARLSTNVTTMSQEQGDQYCNDKIMVHHVGLEPCMMTKLYPGMEFVTLGAHISNCHSPTESLHIQSVRPFYNTLLNIIRIFE